MRYAIRWKCGTCRKGGIVQLAPLGLAPALVRWVAGRHHDASRNCNADGLVIIADRKSLMAAIAVTADQKRRKAIEFAKAAAAALAGGGKTRAKRAGKAGGKT